MSQSLVLFSSPTLLDAAYLARNVHLSESWGLLTELRRNRTVIGITE